MPQFKAREEKDVLHTEMRERMTLQARQAAKRLFERAFEGASADYWAEFNAHGIAEAKEFSDRVEVMGYLKAAILEMDGQRVLDAPSS